MKFHEMTWPQIRQLDRSSTLVVAPIAACEQHGRHLPTFTDSLLVGAVAEGVEARLADRVLLLPVQWFGASEHHLPFGATLTARVDTHVTLLCELLAPLLADGFRRVMLLNGHGGNIDTLHVALRRLQPLYRNCLLLGAAYWELASRELADLCDGPLKEVGHACEIETSMVMALRPELVRTEQIADDHQPRPEKLRGLFDARDMGQITHDGADGFPSYATPEKGRKFLDAAVRRTVEVCQGVLEMPLPGE
jgi:creatinine amidohydrolase